MTRRTTARLAGFMFLAYIAIGITGLILFKRATGGAGGCRDACGMAQHAPLVRDCRHHPADVLCRDLTLAWREARLRGSRASGRVADERPSFNG